MTLSRKIWKRLLTALAGLALGAAVLYLFLPQPLDVDVAQVTRGPLRVTVDEDGKTRVKERYIVSSPLAGRLLRIELHAGDLVEAEKTLLAQIEPVDPQLLDVRSKAEAEARVRAAEANRQRAGAELRRAQEGHELAAHNLERARNLIRSKAISREDLDKAEHTDRQTAEELNAAQFAVKVSQFEMQLAQAAFLRTRESHNTQTEPSSLLIRSPINGQVLRVLQESDRVVSPGIELLEIGDLANLEAEIDVLSADAVKIKPDTDVWFERWGGQEALKGRVRRVEPSGFTKISALGVEEQRVNVLIDFVDPVEKRRTLGDAFRVEARIVVWQGANVLKVPSGALFRNQGNWAVFVANQGQALLRDVQIGKNNGVEAEVVSGLQEGDLVVLYPSDKIGNQVKIERRTEAVAEPNSSG
jgi:HlyD family secretion protein